MVSASVMEADNMFQGFSYVPPAEDAFSQYTTPILQHGCDISENPVQKMFPIVTFYDLLFIKKTFVCFVFVIHTGTFLVKYRTKAATKTAIELKFSSNI